MRIKSIQCADVGPRPWQFAAVKLNRINLLVGATGSGKTRFLNFLFNVGRFAVGAATVSAARWEIVIGHEELNITWKFESAGEVNNVLGGKPQVVTEQILIQEKDEETNVVVDRTAEHFKFLGNDLPKIAPEQSAITLLKAEDVIQPIYQVFLKMIKRSFSEATQNQYAAYSVVTHHLREKMKPGNVPTELTYDIGLSVKLLMLRECLRDKYDRLIAAYRAVFPFIENCEISSATKFGLDITASGEVPVFAIKERDVPTLIPLHELSSGMIKVLLIMTDIITLQHGHTYLIDEYENSLGVNAIDFLPAFLEDNAADSQFLITTHHPCLINNMPIRNWCLFRRTGSDVTIIPGEQLAEKFGKSKQQAFIQLLNDPAFSGV